MLGLGQIGRALAARAEVFGMAVRYCNRSAIEARWPRLADPVALAADSDVLAVCVAASADTKGMVDAAVLDALGPQGVLVNIARGSVVDEERADRGAARRAVSPPPGSTCSRTSRGFRRRCWRCPTRC